MKAADKSLFCLGVLLSLLSCPDTASAQSNTLTANPQQLTFNMQAGVTPSPQTLLVQSSTGAVSVTISTQSSNNWLVVSPAAGQTPLSLTVSIGPGAPTSGTDVGFINISGGSSFLSVPVILNVSSSGGTSPLSATPNSLSYSFAAGSTIPSTQQITISTNDASVKSFTASPVTGNGGTWLSVSPPSASLPSTLQVTVNPAALQGAGPFNGSVAINASGVAGINVPVLVTLAGTPSLVVSPSQISLAYQIGTATPAPATLALTTSTGANIAFTASTKTANCGANWIVLSQQSGATPGSLSVSINTSLLVSPASCMGEVDIAAPGASNPNVVLPVSVLVTSQPLLQGPSTGPTFNYQIGSNTPPAAQNVQITSSTGTLNFTATASPVNGGPNFLSISPAAGATPQALTLSVNQTVLPTLGPGTYGETVTVTGVGAGNPPLSFPVTLVVSSTSVLTANVAALNFNYQTGLGQPASQSFTVSSTGAPLNFQVAANTSSCGGFLSATPSNGVTLAGQNQIAVSVNTAGITPQVCSGNITVTVPGSSAPPLVISATLTVSSTPLLNVGQSSINVTTLSGAAATMLLVPITSTDPATQLQFTALAATSPIGLTWLSVSPNSGNTATNLVVTISPANLPVGTYNGTITVAGAGSNSNLPAQTIPVTMVIASGTLTASSTSLSFTQSLGGAPPGVQAVEIGGVPAGATIGALTTLFNGTGWLNAGVSGGTLSVSVNGAQLAQGTYTGVVTVIVPGASNSPLYISVTLTVGAQLSLLVSPSSLNFVYQAGSGSLPKPQAVSLATNGGNVPFNAAFTPGTGGNFISFSPVSGTTPATITISMNGNVLSNLGAGTYTGTLTISSASIPTGQNVIINLTVTPQAPPVVAAIASSASLQSGPIAPGEIVTLFGTAIGPATPVSGVVFTPTAQNTVPTSLGNVTVTFNNVAAPLLFVSGTQINAIAPYELAGQITANVVVQVGGVASAAFQVRITDTVPAIFSLTQNGNGQGAILNQDQSVNGAANPAAAGTVISIYATGEGQIVPGLKTGSITPATPPFPKPVGNVSVSIGGKPAQLTFVGEAPTLVTGVLQVNVLIPDNLAAGNQAVVLTIGSATNALQAITVSIK